MTAGLWAALTRRTEQALRSGALLPIPTESDFLEQAGVRFLLRTPAALSGEERARTAAVAGGEATGEAFNPFLPYDEDLFVADVSETHVCLLNKFNVIEHHLLIVTRGFVDQETLLDERDFTAMWACMAEFDGLAFYNGGKAGGASQHHKHLQMVPLPFAPEGPKLPVGPLIAVAEFDGGVGTVPGLPFRHAIARTDPAWPGNPSTAGASTLESYRTLLRSVGLDPAGRTLQAGPYNLLVTREWMLLVPRSRESFESISVNSLGYAGSLFVRNAAQAQALRDIGPMTLLRHVGVALPPGRPAPPGVGCDFRA